MGSCHRTLLSIRTAVRPSDDVCKSVGGSMRALCTLTDNDSRHHSDQNVVPSESTTNFDHCDDQYRCR